MSVLFVKHPYECKCGGSMKFLLYIKIFALSNPQKIKKIYIENKTRHHGDRRRRYAIKGSSHSSYFFFSASIICDIVYTRPAST